MKLVVIEGTFKTHAPRLDKNGAVVQICVDRLWTVCGRPFQGQRRTEPVRMSLTEGSTPSCQICRKHMWNRSRVAVA